MRNPKFNFTLSILCAAIFVVKNPLDYLHYSRTLNSAPFWVNILVNAIYFLIPALIFLAAGWILGRKK